MWGGPRGPPARGPPPAPGELQLVLSLADRLPYRERAVVRHQAAQVVEVVKTLLASEDVYIMDNGSSHHLIKLDGTIRTTYAGTSYNTPLTLHIPLGFPAEPPIAHVNPGKDMFVKKNHPIVRPSGRVLVRWARHMSLLDLINTLSREFGNEPPLYHARSMIADEVKKRYRKLHDELITELTLQEELSRRAEQLRTGEQSLRDTKQMLQRHLSSLEARHKEADVVAASRVEMESKIREADPLSLVEADSVVAGQMFDLVAKATAVDDALYFLEKALGNDVITLKDFVKAVRRLSMQQFEARALINKIFPHQAAASAAGMRK